MRESHPYLNEGIIVGATRLILGSFPVYVCTDPDSDEKKDKRLNDGSFRFFYGSYRSRFWILYQKFIDLNFTIPFEMETAIKSLKENKIAISDIIKSCNRRGKGASDLALFNIDYNTLMIQEMINSGVTKILCTSKGVMEVLHHKIIVEQMGFHFDESKTKNFEAEILFKLNGSPKKLKKPICRVYVLNGKSIYVLAVPSPGSPYRQIHNFGWDSEAKIDYADKYFDFAFNWIKSDF